MYSRTQHNVLNEKISFIEDEIKNFKSSLSDEKSKLRDLKSELSEAITIEDNAAITAKADKVKINLEFLKKRIKSLDQEIVSLKAKRLDLLKERDQEIIVLNDAVEMIEAKRKEYRESYVELAIKIAELAELDRLEVSRLNEAENMADDLDIKLDTFEERASYDRPVTRYTMHNFLSGSNLQHDYGFKKLPWSHLVLPHPASSHKTISGFASYDPTLCMHGHLGSPPQYGEYPVPKLPHSSIMDFSELDKKDEQVA